jgi:hypothetical protein
MIVFLFDGIGNMCRLCCIDAKNRKCWKVNISTTSTMILSFLYCKILLPVQYELNWIHISHHNYTII